MVKRCRDLDPRIRRETRRGGAFDRHGRNFNNTLRLEYPSYKCLQNALKFGRLKILARTCDKRTSALPGKIMQVRVDARVFSNRTEINNNGNQERNCQQNELHNGASS